MRPEKSLWMGDQNYNHLFNLLDDAIYVFGPDDKFLDVNDVACNRLGYTHQELLQLNLQKISAPELSKEVLNNIAKVKKKKKLIFESIHVTKEGLKIPVEINANLIKYNDQPVILIISKNIEEHVITKKKLKKTKAKYRDLYENAPNAFFSINMNHSIVKCNAGAERLLGYSKSDLINQNIFEIFADTENGKEKVKRIFQEFSKGEEIQDEELQMQGKNGGTVWISLSLRPIPSKHGKIVESLLMAINIDKRKKIEQLLKDSELKYREAYDRANFFKDVIIHDVNNIFQVIRS
ncbi:MAG: PAS domain S-box protein, partial [Promethearchaeota archaeon]